ncbi:MAG: uracil-DNA glycosylase [Planctomycetes bacterium]|nr:uracil-DNA glycosylase [Planctomycetota bacterium]
MIRSKTGDHPFAAGQEMSWRRVLSAESYPDFREALCHFDCRRCPLHSDRNCIVVDRGHPRARVVLIGEGPGAEEDRRGEAFVGASGRLLDDMMRDAGLDPETDVLIINVVKCRPPGNRAPVRKEVDRCMPYLRRQIELVSPRFVALLGSTAVRHLLVEERTSPIRDLAGRFFASPILPDSEILVTYHPAYVLRSRGKKQEMVDHLVQIANRLHDQVS